MLNFFTCAFKNEPYLIFGVKRTGLKRTGLKRQTKMLKFFWKCAILKILTELKRDGLVGLIRGHRDSLKMVGVQ